MAFTDDDIRASHIIRAFGTNKDEEILHDIWLDIERVDVYRIVTKVKNGQWQGMYRRLYWNDDSQDSTVFLNPGEGNDVRLLGTKKICSPDEEDQEDPDEWIPIKTIIQMEWGRTAVVKMAPRVRGNRTDAENEIRVVEARRCWHRETIIDKDVEKAIERDPNRKEYVVGSDEYDWIDEHDEAKQDKDDFIEVQYVSFTLDKASPDADAKNKYQGVFTNLKNSHYLNFTEEAKGPVNPVHGFDPPWALDIFQAIVNVQFGGLAVDFGDKDKDAPEKKK